MKKIFGSAAKVSYRVFQRVLVENCVLPFYFSKQRLVESKLNNKAITALGISEAKTTPSSRPSRIWFHAASVGELESLWPVILSANRANYELILTILSESARSSLEKLRQTLTEQNAKIIFSGYSPWEGRWLNSFKRLQPSLFVTAKYEAWPDLWLSLREEKIPLAIISARARKSLLVAKGFCKTLSQGVPRLLLFPCVEEDVPALRKFFPDSSIEVVGEPRWDRVFERARTGNIRAKQLIEKYQSLKRPWGVIGSAWLEDLEFLENQLKKFSGTLWVVPHRIDAESVNQIEEFLKSSGLNPMRTSPRMPEISGEAQRSCVLVNELGFLSELYSVADWAFVGGGFGAGVHSTIEPAIYGIPIGVGPHGTKKFSEIKELTKTGQLSILKNAGDASNWMNQLSQLSHQKRDQWVHDAQSRLGATQKILTAIENFK